jgi:hypothetical protein
MWKLRRLGAAVASLELFASSFALAVTPAGETCNLGPSFGVNFTDADNTAGRMDDYDPSLATTCPIAGGDVMLDDSGLGPDLVYHLVTIVGGTLQITLDPTNDDDLALYVVSPSCTAGVFTMNCIVGDDNGGGGSAENVSFNASAESHYFVVVDGFQNNAGPFTLAVTGLLSPLDIDGDGEVEALTDGLLMLRYHFGFTGSTLITNAIDVAHCSRCGASEVQAYLGLIKQSL